MKALNYILSEYGYNLIVEQVTAESPYSLTAESPYSLTAESPFSVQYQIEAYLAGMKKTSSRVLKCKFCGFPDFVLRSGHRRRMADVQRIRAVGETQSKPGIHSVQDAIAQAGIYATGLLTASEPGHPLKKLLTIEKYFCVAVRKSVQQSKSIKHGLN